MTPITILSLNQAFSKKFLTALKEERDFKVLEAHSLRNVEDILPRQKIDIIIAKFDFFEDLDEVKGLIQKGKGQKVAVTGDVDRDIVFEYIKLGVKGFLSCDISSNLLKKAIRAIHKGEVWYDRETSSRIFEEFALRQAQERAQPEILECLSKREKEVLHLVAKGLKNKDIADALHVSEKTIKTHLYHIYEKLGVENRINAALFVKKNV